MYSTPLTIVALLGGTALLYGVSLVIYRLALHPLSKFPGPKLAAATLWYEFYYEVVKKGQLTFKIREWHQQYGIPSLPPHRTVCANQFKVPSFVSIPMRSISTTQKATSTTPFSPAPVSETKILTTHLNLELLTVVLEQYPTTSTVVVEKLSIPLSPKLRSCA